MDSEVLRQVLMDMKIEKHECHKCKYVIEGAIKGEHCTMKLFGLFDVEFIPACMEELAGVLFYKPKHASEESNSEEASK